MIPQTKIDEVFGDKMAKAIGIKMRLADQKIKKPERPYATYDPMIENVESSHRNVRRVTEKDATNAEIHRDELSGTIVSLQFIGDKNAHIDILRTAARAAMKWVKENKVDDVTMRLISPSVQRLPAFVEQNYQYKLWFDMRLDYKDDQVQDIESMNTVEATGTSEGNVTGDIDQEITVSAP